MINFVYHLYTIHIIFIPGIKLHPVPSFAYLINDVPVPLPIIMLNILHRYVNILLTFTKKLFKEIGDVITNKCITSGFIPPPTFQTSLFVTVDLCLNIT